MWIPARGSRAPTVQPRMTPSGLPWKRRLGIFSKRVGFQRPAERLDGGITAQLLSEGTVRRVFAVVMAIIAILMLRTRDQRNTFTGTSVDPGLLGGRYDDALSGEVVTYRVKRLPLALIASFVAGNV